MAKVLLTVADQEFLVDDIDYKYAISMRWHVDSKGYLRASTKIPTWLHREICPVPEGFCVDHINGDPMDNRRSNLRQASTSQNQANRKPTRKGTSVFKGVSRLPSGKWQAQIRKDGVNKYLGSYSEELDAARAYDWAALAEFGEYAWGNNINPGEEPPQPNSAA